jgi:hypothetical protein
LAKRKWYPGKWHDIGFTGRRREPDQYISTGAGLEGEEKKVKSGDIIDKGVLTGWPELKPTKTSYVPQYDLPPSIIGKKDFKSNVPYYQGLTPFKGDTLTLPKLKEPAVIKDYTPRTYKSIKESKRPSQLETLEQKKERFRRMILEPGMLGTQDKFAGGGIANLTRTVAPDSGPMSQGLRSLYIDDMDY